MPQYEPRRPLPSRVGAVIFDCDGLLVDTETRWGIAERAMFERHGHAFGPAQKAALVGKSLPDATRWMAEQFGTPGAQGEISRQLVDLVSELLRERTDPMPGAAELVATLRERVPLAVASNSIRAHLDLSLHVGGFGDLAPRSVAADEVAHPKPAPDLYRRACELAGADPTTCVAFEDSPSGAAAARAAGLYVVVVPSMAGVPDDHDWHVDSLADADLVAWAERVEPLTAG